MQDMTDSALVKHAQRGETQAFGGLVERYQQSVFNVCYRILGQRQDAEDLTQDAFVRAYQKLDTFDPTRSFGPWARKIAANLCLNVLQKKVFQNISLDNGYAQLRDTKTPSPEKSHLLTEQNHQIIQAIGELTPQQRVVIELRHYQNLSYQEIADTLNMAMSDVKSHLFRGRKQLAKKLADYEKTI